jgi:hypothetical protein
MANVLLKEWGRTEKSRQRVKYILISGSLRKHVSCEKDAPVNPSFFLFFF